MIIKLFELIKNILTAKKIEVIIILILQLCILIINELRFLNFFTSVYYCYLLSIFFHELGHIIACKFYKIDYKNIVIKNNSRTVYIEIEKLDNNQNRIIAASGAFTNLILILICIILMQVLSLNIFSVNILTINTVVNLIFAITFLDSEVHDTKVILEKI